MKVGDIVVLTGEGYWVPELIGRRAIITDLGVSCHYCRLLEGAGTFKEGHLTQFNEKYNNQPTVRLDESYRVKETLDRYL